MDQVLCKSCKYTKSNKKHQPGASSISNAVIKIMGFNNNMRGMIKVREDNKTNRK